MKEALIPAGGKGTRLREITEDKIPKALVEVAPGKTVLDLTIEGLRKIGVKTIAISVFHLGDQIKEYLHEHYRDWHLDIIEEEKELGTGGSIQNFIAQGQNVPFLFTPADNYVTWNKVKPFSRYAGSKVNDALAVWAVSLDPTYSQVPNNVWFDKKNKKVVACTSGKTPEEKAQIHARYEHNDEFQNVTSAGILGINHQYFPPAVDNYQPPFCLYKDLLPQWTAEDKKILAALTQAQVIDVGTPERLAIVKQLLAEETKSP